MTIMISCRTVLISGASVAGPALAYWLCRYGFKVTVIEQAKALREGGYKVDIRGAAVEVAERMGIMDDIRRASTDMQGATFVNEHNKAIATFTADEMAGRSNGDDEIMRGDLAQILYERTRNNVEYIFGDSIRSLEQKDDRVTVTFEHGTSRDFDLVVGADGLHSNVRRLTFGDEAQFVRHLGAYISIWTIPNDLQLDRWELYYAMPGGKAACMYSTRGSADAKGLLIFNSPQLSYSYRDIVLQRKMLADKFKGDGWQIQNMLNAAESATDFYFDSISLIQMERWSENRVVLLGDAAYCASPSSGQGTGLALIGAYILAGELAVSPDNYRAAFAAYEQQMRPFVEKNQGFAINAVKSLMPQGRVQIWIQQLMMRILSYLPWKGLIFGKMGEEMKRISNAIVLKEYKAVEKSG